jgi:arsenate reductase
MKATIYHNPRCSKSRATLSLLEERGIDVEICEYLQTPPPKAQLQALLNKLGLRARDIVRSAEPELKAARIDLDAPADVLLDLIVKHPKILQRPIVEFGSSARIGRPPENVLELFE